MSISLKTHKMLWGRAANRCAFPDCRQDLVMDASETDDEALVGEECHIVAREPGGPRGDHSLLIESRDKYSNLILLCSTHHTLIDKQPQKYTVQYLQELKAAHEKWVRESLQGFDPIKQRDEERYAAYIEEWVKLAHLNTWRDWLDWLFYSDEPQITKEKYDSLEQFSFWLSSRIWPKRYPELEAAFENFRRVLVDLLNVFDVHAFRKEVLDSEEVKEETITYKTNKFYRRHEGDEYEIWVERYLFYLDFLLDLGLELTRAANYIWGLGPVWWRTLAATRNEGSWRNPGKRVPSSAQGGGANLSLETVKALPPFLPCFFSLISLTPRKHHSPRHFQPDLRRLALGQPAATRSTIRGVDPRTPATALPAFPGAVAAADATETGHSRPVASSKPS